MTMPEQGNGTDQESQRLCALFSTGLLDTPPDERFDRITRLVAQFFSMPIALVSLIDEQRQWFKSRYGLSVRETPRSQAFCAHAVVEGRLLIVEDATLDARFKDNPLVTGAPMIRFYAGEPFFSSDGYALGTLCMIDTVPRQLTAAQIACLRDFALLVGEEFNKAALSHHALLGTRALQESEAKFEATFEQAAVGMAHVDLDGKLLHVNHRFHEIVGYKKGVLEKMSFQEITHPDDLELDLRMLGELLAGQRTSYSIEKRYLHKAGYHVWVNLTVALVRTPDHAPVYFISVIEDIQEKKETQLALQRLNDSLEARVTLRTAELERVVHELGFEVSQRINVEAELRMSEEHTRTILEASLDAFVGIDSHGAIINWNRAAEETFGWTAAEVIGAQLASTIIPPEHHLAHQIGLEHFFATGKGEVVNRRLELPARTRSGQVITVEMTISPYLIGTEMFLGAFLHDISERREAAEKLERKQTLLDAVLDSVGVGVVACDGEGKLNVFNRAAAKLHGMVGDIAGNPADSWAREFDLYSGDGVTPMQKEEVPLFRALRGQLVDNVEMSIVPKGQSARFVLTSGQRLVAASGESLGAVVAMTDVTALKNLEQQRAVNESRLLAITENLPALIGHIDKDQKFLFLNKHALRFYGKTEDQLLGQSVHQLYSEQEYLDVKPYIDSAMAGTKASFESQMQLNGKTRHFSAVYIPEKQGGSGTRGFYAMAMDITARKNSELRQAVSEERLRTITDNLPVLIAYIDSDEVYQFANATYEKWFGVSPHAMIGKKVEQVLSPELYMVSRPYLLQNLAGSRTRFETTYNLNGRSTVAEVVGMPHVSDGVVLGVYVMATDISATRQHEAQLQLLARADPLTGLPNRRSYEEKLRECALRSVRSGRAMGLMYLDIDFFKQINDTLGHAGGDEVLKEFGHRLRSAVRATDAVCRLAGDEFTIILEGVNPGAEIVLVADKILAAVRQPFFADGTFHNVTASIGIACHEAAQLDVAALSKAADTALYAAKAAGRNRYSVAPEF